MAEHAKYTVLYIVLAFLVVCYKDYDGSVLANKQRLCSVAGMCLVLLVGKWNGNSASAVLWGGMLREFWRLLQEEPPFLGWELRRSWFTDASRDANNNGLCTAQDAS